MQANIICKASDNQLDLIRGEFNKDSFKEQLGEQSISIFSIFIKKLESDTKLILKRSLTGIEQKQKDIRICDNDKLLNENKQLILLIKSQSENYRDSSLSEIKDNLQKLGDGIRQVNNIKKQTELEKANIENLIRENDKLVEEENKRKVLLQLELEAIMKKLNVHQAENTQAENENQESLANGALVKRVIELRQFKKNKEKELKELQNKIKDIIEGNGKIIKEVARTNSLCEKVLNPVNESSKSPVKKSSKKDAFDQKEFISETQSKEDMVKELKKTMTTTQYCCASMWAFVYY